MRKHKQNGLRKENISQGQNQNQHHKQLPGSLVLVITLSVIAVILAVTFSALLIRNAYESKNEPQNQEEIKQDNDKPGGQNAPDKPDSPDGERGSENPGRTGFEDGFEDGGKGSKGNSRKTKLSKDGVQYLVTDGKLIISGEGTVTRDAIANLVTEYNVVDFEMGTFDIGDDAFNGCSNITDMIMRNNVHSIGARAFQGCSMAVVVLGTSITDIGEDAFRDCCHDIVYLANDYIFKNFNSRYDFGGLCETAGICIYKDLMPFEFDADYSKYNDIAGDFLAVSGAFDEFAKNFNAGQTFVEQDYQYWANSMDGDFISIYPGGWCTVEEYDAETNMLDYSVDEEYWENIGRDVELYNQEYIY